MTENKFFILFGGNSYEHEISIVSAMAVAEKLRESACSVGFIYCSYERNFYEIPAEKMRAEFFSGGGFKKCAKLSLAKGGFYQQGLFGKRLVNENAILINLVHGKDGEDGLIAGMLEFYECDYIGARPDACVLSYDKALSKIYAASVGVKTLPYRVVSDLAGAKKAASELGGAIIAKPARLGSSIGIAVAKTPAELEFAFESAREFDEKILLEPFIAGVREINLAGFLSSSGELIFSRAEEPAKAELLGFSDKYLSFKQRDAEAANLSESLHASLQRAFSSIYGEHFAGALIRCDFFIHDGEVLLNEINPHPGSLANYLFEDFAGALKALKRPRPRVLGAGFNYLKTIVQAK